MDKLCEDLPDCFVEFMEYVRQLDFDKKPNYGLCKQMFEDYFQECKYTIDNIWCWHTRKEFVLSEKKRLKELKE